MANDFESLCRICFTALSDNFLKKIAFLAVLIWLSVGVFAQSTASSAQMSSTGVYQSGSLRMNVTSKSEVSSFSYLLGRVGKYPIEMRLMESLGDPARVSVSGNYDYLSTEKTMLLLGVKKPTGWWICVADELEESLIGNDLLAETESAFLQFPKDSKTGKILVKENANFERFHLVEKQDSLVGKWVRFDAKLNKMKQLPVGLKVAGDIARWKHFTEHSDAIVKLTDEQTLQTSLELDMEWPEGKDAVSLGLQRFIWETMGSVLVNEVKMAQVEGYKPTQYSFPKNEVELRATLNKMHADNQKEYFQWITDSWQSDSTGLLESSFGYRKAQSIYFGLDWINENLAQFTYWEYEFNGGAHGMTISYTKLFNVKQQKEIQFKEIIDLRKEKELAKLLEVQLKRDLKLRPDAELQEVGFFEPHWNAISENLSFEKNGITFHYGLYEVAPYSMGFTEITLSYDVLKPFLKPEFADIGKWVK